MTDATCRHFEDVVAGEAIPPLEVTVSLTTLVMYAAATWDFHRYHYDPAFAAAAGFRAPFVDGQMLGALLARQLMQWGGGDAFVRKLNYRLRDMVFAEETIVIAGRVKDKMIEDGRAFAVCTMSIVKRDGSIVVRDATAAVELCRRSR